MLQPLGSVGEIYLRFTNGPVGDWIPITSAALVSSLPADFSTSTSGAVGKPAFGLLELTKALDGLDPLLLNALVTGSVSLGAEIEFWSAGRTTFLGELTLGSVLIDSWGIDVEGSPADDVTLTLNFGQIGWGAAQADANDPASTVWSWNLQTNTNDGQGVPGSLNANLPSGAVPSVPALPEPLDYFIAVPVIGQNWVQITDLEFLADIDNADLSGGGRSGGNVNVSRIDFTLEETTFAAELRAALTESRDLMGLAIIGRSTGANAREVVRYDFPDRTLISDAIFSATDGGRSQTQFTLGYTQIEMTTLDDAANAISSFQYDRTGTTSASALPEADEMAPSTPDIIAPLAGADEILLRLNSGPVSEWIPVWAVDLAFSNSTDLTAGTGGANGKVSFDPVTVIKRADTIDPLLLTTLTDGIFITGAEIEFWAGQRDDFLGELTFGQVLLSDWDLLPDDNGPDLVALTLNFGQIGWGATTDDPLAPASKVWSWNLLTNKSDGIGVPGSLSGDAAGDTKVIPGLPETMTYFLRIGEISTDPIPISSVDFSAGNPATIANGSIGSGKTDLAPVSFTLEESEYAAELRAALTTGRVFDEIRVIGRDDNDVDVVTYDLATAFVVGSVFTAQDDERSKTAFDVDYAQISLMTKDPDDGSTIAEFSFDTTTSTSAGEENGALPAPDEAPGVLDVLGIATDIVLRLDQGSFTEWVPISSLSLTATNGADSGGSTGLGGNGKTDIQVLNLRKAADGYDPVLLQMLADGTNTVSGQIEFWAGDRTLFLGELTFGNTLVTGWDLAADSSPDDDVALTLDMGQVGWGAMPTDPLQTPGSTWSWNNLTNTNDGVGVPGSLTADAGHVIEAAPRLPDPMEYFLNVPTISNDWMPIRDLTIGASLQDARMSSSGGAGGVAKPSLERVGFSMEESTFAAELRGALTLGRDLIDATIIGRHKTKGAHDTVVYDLDGVLVSDAVYNANAEATAQTGFSLEYRYLTAQTLDICDVISAFGFDRSTGVSTTGLAAPSPCGVHLIGDGFANTIRGGTGPDQIEGLSGNDTISGGPGGDTLNGGPGLDALGYESSKDGVLVDLQAGTGTGGDAEGDVLLGFETVTGSAAADQLRGTALDNVIYGGDDTDILQGRAGADAIYGGAGFDFADYGDAPGPLTIDLANPAASSAFFAEDTLFDIKGIFGARSFANAFNGDDERTFFTGGEKADSLSGNDGGDILRGRGGDDTIHGGAGRDALLGNAGNDALYGGPDQDIFWFGIGNDNNDVIFDFTPGVDLLGFQGTLVNELSDLKFGTSAAGWALLEWNAGADSVELENVTPGQANFAANFFFI